MIGLPIAADAIGSSLSVEDGGPPASDTVIPTFVGTLSATQNTNSITVNWSAVTSADDVGVAGRQYRIDAGAWTLATSGEEAAKTHVFNGLSSGTSYVIGVRCVDLSGNVSTPLTLTVVTDANTDSNSVSYTLTDRDGLPLQNLGVLHWALFSQLSPSLFEAPIAKGTIPAAAGPANIEISVLASVAPAGLYILVIASADGASSAAAPVVVS